MRPAPRGAVASIPQESASPPITDGSFQEFSRDLLTGLRDLHAQHGPIAALRDRETAGERLIVCLFDPAYNQRVLSDATTFQARFFGIRGPKRSSQRRVTCGLLAMNGDQHKRNRRMMKEPFGPQAVAAYRPVIERLADEEVAGWHDGGEVDFNERMIRYMLRVTSRLLFGLDESDLVYEIGEQIARWVEMNHELGIGALVPDEAFNAGYEELLDFAERLETNVLRLILARRKNPDPRARDVLSILLAANDSEGGLSDDELVGQCCVLFAAAHMTTAHTFTWTAFLLAQHPGVMRNLWDELHHASDGDSPLLERVIKESMRLLPASAYSLRVNDAPVRLGSLDLPRGTPILFTPLLTHRLPQIYDDPTRFDPDRWLTIRPSAYEYHPFGAGPRRCVGGPLAMEVLRTSLPRFYRDWKLSVTPGAEVAAEVRSTMLNPTHGMPIWMERLAPGVDAPEYEASPTRGNLAELMDLSHVPMSHAPRKPR